MTDNRDNSIPTEERLEFRVALPLFLIVMIDAFSVTVILPLLPYYATAFGMEIYSLGILLATSPVLELLSSPMYRVVSKKLGRRPVLIVSQLGTFLGFLLLGAASTVWMLFLARVIDGIASGNNSIGRRLVRDSLTPDTRTHGLGLVEAAYSLGFLAGPLVGLITLALTNDNYRMIPYIAALISLLAVVLSAILAQETLPPERRKSSGLSAREKLNAKTAPLRNPIVIFLLGIFLLVQFSYIGFIEFYGLLVLSRLGMNALTTAALWIFGGVLVIIVDGVIVGKFSRLFNNRWLVLVGLGMLATGLIFAATTPEVPVQWYSRSEIIEELSMDDSLLGELAVGTYVPLNLPPEGTAGWLGFGWFLLALILIMIGGSMLIPAIKSMLISDHTDYGVSGVLAISSILYKLAFILVPLVLGFAIWRFGFTAPFLVEGLIFVFLLVFAFRWLKSGT